MNPRKKPSLWQQLNSAGTVANRWLVSVAALGVIAISAIALTTYLETAPPAPEEIHAPLVNPNVDVEIDAAEKPALVRQAEREAEIFNRQYEPGFQGVKQSQKHLFGWAGKEKAEAAWEKLKGRFIPFRIVGAPEAIAKIRAEKTVNWDAVKAVNRGQHMPSWQQEIGDCVGFGNAGAATYSLAAGIAFGGKHQSWHILHPSYIYGCSRVYAGRGQMGCNSDGSVGSWAIAAMMEQGVVALDEKGAPAYDGSVSKAWGCRQGPPADLIAIGKTQLVKSSARLRSTAELADALANHYSCPVCSDIGYDSPIKVIDGRLTREIRSSWAHCMFFCGYDPSSKYCFFLHNSWGPLGVTPPDGAPTGGWWITEAAADRMIRTGEVYALSDVAGFPARDWNLDRLRQMPAPKKEGDDDARVLPAKILRLDQPNYAVGL